MTKYIDPSGNGDYLTLPQAITAAPSDLDWICKAGDVAPTTAFIPAGVSVRVDESARCNPLVDAGNSGFAYTSGPITINGNGTSVKHLRCEGHVQTSPPMSGDFNNVEFSDLQIVVSGGSTTVQLVGGRGRHFTGHKFNNNTLFFKDGSGTPRALRLYLAGLGSAAGSLTCEILNNTIINVDSDTLDVGLELFLAANMTVYGEIHNNVVLGALAAFAKTGSGTLGANCSHNAGSDGTATSVLGSSGNLDSQVASDWFVDPVSNLTLKAGSPGIGSGLSGVNIGADRVTV